MHPFSCVTVWQRACDQRTRQTETDPRPRETVHTLFLTRYRTRA